MRKNILIILITGVVILLGAGGIFAFWYLPSHSCPKSCDDGNTCTKDFCSKETNYKCQSSFIENCCGNTSCETVENYGNCSNDCPNCDDSNACTQDTFNYESQTCSYSDIAPCCGNTSCETVENYGNCSKDCPNCNDSNICTKDSYNYESQKCENADIKPCCGNIICEIGENLTCLQDCPLRGVSGFSKVVPISFSVDDSGYLKIKLKNYNTFPIQLNTISIYSQGDTMEDIIAPAGVSKEISLMRYPLKDLSIGDEYNFVITIFYKDLTKVDQPERYQSVGTLAGEIIP